MPAGNSYLYTCGEPHPFPGIKLPPMRNPDRETIFHFKRFSVVNRRCAMKVGTDGVLLAAWCSCPGRRILDVGTGTGVIALIAAQRFPEASVTAIDIDPVAVEEAAANFASSPWPDRLTARKQDFNSLSEGNGNLDETEPFDLIVCNPPFFTNGALAPDEARRTARHEGSLTLDSLLSGAAKLLRQPDTAADYPGGVLSLILPADREEELKSAAVFNKLEISRLTRVSTVPTKPPRRILAALRHRNPTGNSGISESQPTIIESLSLHGSDGTATGEYSALVSPFYLKPVK